MSLKTFVLLACALGCGHDRPSYDGTLAQLIIPPDNADTRAPLVAPTSPAPETAAGNGALLGQPRTLADADDPQVKEPPPPPGCESNDNPVQVMSLAQAINTAFRTQPKLRVYLENVEQARRGEDVAFAPFLPLATAGYSFGGFDLNTGGHSAPLGPLPGFSFLPTLGSVPLGLDIRTGYELAEARLQWLLCDFGRRLGRYRQAGLATDIAQLQSERAFQTVANEVSVAYYQVLRARALNKTARDAVRRAEDDLKVARNLARGGALVTEKVLRAQVLLAENQRLLDKAEGAEAVALASLNLAIGWNVNTAIDVEERAEIPPFTQSLAECLQAAVAQRREFQVARRSIQVAEEGRGVARADFAPKILAEGAYLDFQQSSPRSHLDLPFGFIKLEWGIFEGGKRVAEMRISDSKLRAAVAEAESIADTIAFQVTEAYRNLVTAHRGIERSRPAVAQAQENQRLVRARAALGAATTAEITDAESALTRAQADYLNSIHDYLIALARLEYAMGVAVTENR